MEQVKMEWEIKKWERKMYPYYVDQAIHSLELLLDYLQPQLPHLIDSMILDLRFFKMFLWGLAYQIESSDEYLQFLSSTMRREFRQAAEKFSSKIECASDREELIANWEPMSDNLKNTIQQNKENAKHICLHLLYDRFKCKSRPFEGSFLEYADHTISFIALIQENLRILESKMVHLTQVRETFASIESKLKVFGKFAFVAKHSRTPSICIFHTHDWANHISCLTCLYWIDADILDEVMAYQGEITLFNLMQRYMPYSPRVISLYLNVLRANRYCAFQVNKVINELFEGYVDFLIEPLVIPTKEVCDHVREGLIFLLSYIWAPLKYTRRQRIMAEAIGILSEVVSLICGLETNLSGLLLKIDGFKIKVRELCALTPLPPRFGFPKTNPIGFIISFSANLKEMLKGRVDFIPFVKHQVEIVQEQLVLIMSTLQSNMDLQSGCMEVTELKNLWTQIINVVYIASYVIKLCPVTSQSMWYGIIFLPVVTSDVCFVNSELQKFRDGTKSSDKRVIDDDAESSNAVRVQAKTSENDVTFIGFEQDVIEIRDQLVFGREPLTIVSISGMPGQGKTTLAKRIYDDLSIELIFHIKVWCYVSKECKTKVLLEKLARDIGCTDIDEDSDIQDVIEKVWRKLKGHRYLIVLDDIWDVGVWLQVRGSFPNDNNRSRILFTSRNHNLASQASYHDLPSQANPPSVSYHLRAFSEAESWELMKNMLYSVDGLPPEFSTIGKQISDYCKGLPLAVAIVGALLKGVGQELDLWKHVAENLKTYLGEGCMHIIELSYKYLAEHLKPCFLYFAAFRRGKDIYAENLKLLWIAEGFVKENEMQLSEKYLNDLVSQNLVVVTSRSFRGGIEGCRVHHDLLYDLCLKKAEQDDFLHLAHIDIVDSYDYLYRICIKEDAPVTLQQSTSVRELPTSQTHTLLLLDRYKLDCITTAWFLNLFKVLTVLDVEFVTTFPEEILHLIHLRYLALKGAITYIPAPIIGLWNLETLILQSIYPVQAPDTLWEMESLKYVQTSLLHINKSPIFTAETCNIEVLKGIALKCDLKTKEFLRRLVRLRELTCYCLYDDDDDVIHAGHPVWFSIFASLEKLDSLNVSAHRDELMNDSAVWNKSPVYRQFPTFKFLHNLKSLELESLRLPWRVMSDIGKLTNLEFLSLLDDACEEISSYHVTWFTEEDMKNIWRLECEGFPKLRYLKLEYLSIEQLDVSLCEYPFPCLQKLFVNDCLSLKEIPLSFGGISTLETISVSGSRELLNSVRRIVEESSGNLQVFGINDDMLNDDSDEEGSEDDNFDSYDDDDDDEVELENKRKTLGE